MQTAHGVGLERAWADWIDRRHAMRRTADKTLRVRLHPPRLLTVSTVTGAALLGLAATELVHRSVGYPSFLLLLPLVILASAQWGAIAGAVATCVTTVGMAALMPPARSLAVEDPAHRMMLALFVAVSAVSVLAGSRQQRTRAALIASEREFRALFELAAVGTAKVDLPTGRILNVNQRFCEMTGYTCEELQHLTIDELTHPDDRPADTDIRRQAASSDLSTWTVEKRYLRRDGAILWVIVNAVVIRDADGDHIIGHAADISARRHAEEQAREAIRLKDEFLATLSHELRTPLNVVAGWVHMLRRPTSPIQVEHGLEVIDRNVATLRVLTEDLLGLADISTGRVRMRRRTVDLSSVLHEIVESTLSGDLNGISLDATIQPSLQVRGDENRLRQVFWNLMTNSLKFTPPGGSITVTALLDNSRIKVVVSDTGAGITPDFLPHVFDRFRQEDSSRTRRYAGLGVGLAVARQFVELHGGTIIVESPGRDLGTIVSVDLPALESEPQAEPQPSLAGALR
jgi:PAS domain S-box-containing protein